MQPGRGDASPAPRAPTISLVLHRRRPRLRAKPSTLGYPARKEDILSLIVCWCGQGQVEMGVLTGSGPGGPQLWSALWALVSPSDP